MSVIERDRIDHLASFASEAAIAKTPVKSEQENPLWEFPEESSRSAAVTSRNPRAVRKLPVYAALAATVVAAVVAGAWWSGLIPQSHSLATDTTADSVVTMPAVSLSADASTSPATPLIPSVEVRPSTQPPLASIVPSVARDDGRIAESPPKPVSLSGTEPERRPPTQPVTSMSRGTSGAVVPTPRLGVRPYTEPIPPQPQMVVENPAPTSPAPQPRPVEEALPAAAVAAAPPPRILAPEARPDPAVVSTVMARTEQSEIQRALGRYRSAYQLLDAGAAQDVWPSVDVRALARAFDSLTSQQLAFETCEYDIAGEAATAQCRGSATYTPKVGNRESRLEPRQWTFQLRKMGEDWKIQSAQTRR